MLFPLYLRVDPDPVLHSRVRRVDLFNQSLKDKVNAMNELMSVYKGQGIAANQAGLLDSIAIIGDLGPLVNLSIEPVGPDKNIDFEGCLSLPGVIVEVERYSNIILSGQDVEGISFKESVSDHLARVAQHEVDHLNGVLIIDRIPASEKRKWLY